MCASHFEPQQQPLFRVQELFRGANERIRLFV